MSAGKGRQMKKALEYFLAPAFLARGFDGKFPVLRRRRKSELDVLELQFDRYGGGFRLNLGVCSSEGITTAWGKKISPEDMRFGYPMLRKYHVDPRNINLDKKAEAWFRFDDVNTEGVAKQMLTYVDLIDHWFLTGEAPMLPSEPRKKGGPIHSFVSRFLRL